MEPDPTAQLRDSLVRKLSARRVTNKKVRDRLEGCGAIPDSARTDEFRRLLEMSRVDLGQIIVEAVSERTNINGFRTEPDDIDGDDVVGQAWAKADGPLQFSLAIEEAVSVGDGYLFVDKRGEGEEEEYYLCAESSDNVVVQYKPGSRTEITAALKVWYDCDDPMQPKSFATLITEDKIYRYAGEGVPFGDLANVTAGVSWSADGEVVDHGYGRVPVVHLRNRPQLKQTWGRAEIFGLENDLDRANKLMADLMLISEFSGYRVRYATGIDVETEDVKDSDGNVIGEKPVQPFEVGPDRLLIATNSEAKFGDLDETSIDPQINGVKMAVSQVAALSRTPLFYLSGDLVNLSGDSLREMREQLRRKVEQRQAGFARGAVDACAMLLELVVGSAPDTLEVIWKAVDEVSVFEAAQAVVGLVAGEIIPSSQAQIDLGYDTATRTRMAIEIDAERARKQAEAAVQAEQQAQLAERTAAATAAAKPAPAPAGAPA